MNFSLIQRHKYNLNDIENMLPFEREIYIGMLLDYLEEEKERLSNNQ
jgi:hypothetical protein